MRHRSSRVSRKWSTRASATNPVDKATPPQSVDFGYMIHHIHGGADVKAYTGASYIVVGVMSVIALGLLEPANIAVLFEMRKPQPDGEVIAKLMKRFIYTAGILGLMQVATLVIMTRLAS